MHYAPYTYNIALLRHMVEYGALQANRLEITASTIAAGSANTAYRELE
jgi:hypothetical protein